MPKMRKYLQRLKEAPILAPKAEKPAPVIVAGHGPGLMKVAAELGDGSFLYLQSPETTKQAREVIGPDKELHVALRCVLDPNPETARDLARFGMLYLQNGVWQGERLISEDWIEFVRTPAPATADIGNAYGGQWWLVPDNRTDVPRDAYSTAGNRGQYTIVVPSHDLVIVRRGLDYGRQGFNRWELTREVLKAFDN